MAQFIIFRHGESLWNLENRFTGWVDVELTETGIQQAKEAGKKLKQFKIDTGYTSELKRAKQSLLIALKESNNTNIPVIVNKALNERMYGDLQGLNKLEAAKHYGEQQVKLWRRSYDIAPPNGESLKDTFARVIPYYETEIKPELSAGKNCVVVTHGNTMRALVMHLENLSPEQITKLEFGTGEMRLYELDTDMTITKMTNL